ncbi:bifunctional UDP-sugar hydrolase/5'-nucleotidase [Fictibacillus enclensis]|uniref:bifunctional metallophosphatase/5'-nucleotidase n=1 Tax=Fictibacillus enclensis TaxID=1017270 RepID=UPI0025A20562|nr:bifunctional UDP-sugar hydrolase/5'-nucleotidase [Fictibacillus enclensis]MDM5339729.1 bifunctional UDP-sugar hydrolase/5'-nucleotidase [Fictibacillus enclensis]
MQNTLTIYHTNDIHSHFESWTRIVHHIKTAQKRIQDKEESVFYFDCGDFMDRANPLTEGTLGQGNTLLLNQAGTFAATIGNNEGITLTKDELDALYTKADFPVLAANIFNEQGVRPPWAKRSEVFTTKDGLMVGVTGVTIAFQAFYESLGWQVKDPFLLLPEIVAELKKTSDIVIVLSHLGLNFDERMAEEIEGIDVILGAHTHHVLPQGKEINGTLIAQTGKFGMYLGEVNVQYDTSTKKITSKSAELIDPFDEEEDREGLQLLNELMIKGETELKQEVGTLKNPLHISWYEPSPFAQLMADALKEWCQTAYSMINSGVILESLPAGPVTKGDLHRICPHPINPCLVDLTGDEIKEIVNASLSQEMIHREVKGFGFRGKVMGRMAFSGITAEEELLEDRQLHVRRIEMNGEPVKDEEIYRVAVIDMFTFGKLYPAIARNKNKTFMLPETLRDLLEWKLASMIG